MDLIETLEPKEVWIYFREILKIPRPSMREGKIISYLLDFAQRHGLESLRDEAGNVLIRKPAAPGMENRMGVILQSHVDMVCEKNSDVDHDFNAEGINAYADGDWVRARGTTLGADDGIGVAAQLAVLASSTLSHGPIECLFTVNEETGLTGAKELQSNFLGYSILLNLDSEDDGELFIGCAGGIDTEATFFYEKAKVPSNSRAFKLSVTGLKGGHSGDDIDKGLGNSLKIINRFLWKGTHLFDLRLSHLQGGNLHNAIPREATAIITIHEDEVEGMLELFSSYKTDLLSEFKHVEPSLSINLEETCIPLMVIDEPTHFDLLNSLYACPHGVLAMSQSMQGLVETSTNLASVNFIQDFQIRVTTSQRSSVESSKVDAANMVESVFRLANASVMRSGGYPGWTPNSNSLILGVLSGLYLKLFGVQPVVRAIHAGLECGLFLEKYPKLDMISFGPTIKGAHSPSERLSISSVARFWLLLTKVLESSPEPKG